MQLSSDFINAKSYFCGADYHVCAVLYFVCKSRGAGRCEGRDAGVSASLGDSTDRFFFVDFILLALSHEKLEETGKEEE